MPFANKFRAMMDMPFAGDMMDEFVVEEINVRDMPGGPGSLHSYAIEMILCGPGGQQGVKRTLRPMLQRQPTTFSGYGNPYLLWFGKPEIESLGNKRYAVSIEGAGVRVNLEDILERFLAHLDEKGHFKCDQAARCALIEAYLEQYRAEISRSMGRYRSRLRRSG